MLKLNRIRNSVMHPVRNATLTEEDFEFVRELDGEMRNLTVHMPEHPEQVPLSEDIGMTPTHELVSSLSPVGGDEAAGVDEEKQESPDHDAA